MKKLFILFVFLVALTGCVREEIPEITDENYFENTVPEKTEITIFESEDGKYGLSMGEKIIAEAIYDYIEIPNDDEALFYRYKAFVFGGTELFLEEGGKHFFKVSEKPAKRFYLLDAEGKPMINVAFEKIECHYAVDNNNNSIPYYLAGVSEGKYYKYDFIDGGLSLTEYIGTENEEADFGYTITKYSYNLNGYIKRGVKSGEKVIEENTADKIDIPFENRIIIYCGAVWQAFDCGRCLLLDEEGNVLSDKFNRIEFLTFDDGSYVGMAFTAGSVAESPTFDENGEQMPIGVWFIDKNGNMLSENLFDEDLLINYYTLEDDSATVYCRDYDGNESKIEIPFEGYIIK